MRPPDPRGSRLQRSSAQCYRDALVARSPSTVAAAAGGSDEDWAAVDLCIVSETEAAKLSSRVGGFALARSCLLVRRRYLYTRGSSCESPISCSKQLAGVMMRISHSRYTIILTINISERKCHLFGRDFTYRHPCFGLHSETGPIVERMLEVNPGSEVLLPRKR